MCGMSKKFHDPLLIAAEIHYGSFVKVMKTPDAAPLWPLGLSLK
jgi:hypothetical protein